MTLIQVPTKHRKRKGIGNGCVVRTEKGNHRMLLIPHLREDVGQHFFQRQFADERHGDGDGGVHVAAADAARDEDRQSDRDAPAPVNGEEVSFGFPAQNDL